MQITKEVFRKLIYVSMIVSFSFLVYACDIYAGTLRDEAKTYREEGYHAQERGEIDEAIAWYQKTIAFDPNYAAPHNDLGILFESKGWIDRAEEEYKKAITIDPNYEQAHTNLALLYERKGELEKAAFHWMRRYKLGRPGDPWTEEAKSRLEKIGLLDARGGDKSETKAVKREIDKQRSAEKKSAEELLEKKWLGEERYRAREIRNRERREKILAQKKLKEERRRKQLESRRERQEGRRNSRVERQRLLEERRQRHEHLEQKRQEDRLEKQNLRERKRTTGEVRQRKEGRTESPEEGPSPALKKKEAVRSYSYVNEIDRRITRAEDRIDEAVALEKAEHKITRIEQKIDSRTPDVSNINTRLVTVEEQLASTPKSAEVEKRLSSIEHRAEQALKMKEFDNRIGGLESRLKRYYGNDTYVEQDVRGGASAPEVSVSPKKGEKEKWAKIGGKGKDTAPRETKLRRPVKTKQKRSEGSFEEKLQRSLELAEERLRKERMEETIEKNSFEPEVKSYSETNKYYSKAQSYYQRGEYAKALDEIRTGKRDSPQDSSLLELEEKIKDKMKEERIKDLYNEGIMRYQQKDFSGAREEFESILSILPE